MEVYEDLTDDEDFLHLVDLVQNPREIQNYRYREDHFLKWNEKEFRQRFRLSKQVVLFIVDELADQISSPTERNHALSAREKVLVTLRFLATGSILQVVGDFIGIDKSTVSRVIYKVAYCIASWRSRYISMPQTMQEIQCVQRDFYDICRFPRCIGALDCTHIKIQSPGGDNAEIFRNRKGYFSYNVQCICSAKLLFQNIVCRWPGATHDAQIFRNSRVRYDFENAEYRDSLLLGDSGYGIKPYLITPLSNTETPAETLFNESQIRTRNVIERCFGVWKRRFPILALGIRLKHEKVEAIVVAAAVLHNIARITHDPEPDVNQEIEEAINLLENIPALRENHDRNGVNNIVRNALIEYFRNLL